MMGMNKGPKGRPKGPTRPVVPSIPPNRPVAMMAKGGKAKKMDGCCMKGHTKGMMR